MRGGSAHFRIPLMSTITPDLQFKNLRLDPGPLGPTRLLPPLMLTKVDSLSLQTKLCIPAKVYTNKVVMNLI